MNNRKPKNKRGVISRIKFAQFAPEAQLIRVDGELIDNPNYPGVRRIVHTQLPKYNPLGLWAGKQTNNES